MICCVCVNCQVSRGTVSTETQHLTTTVFIGCSESGNYVEPNGWESGEMETIDYYYYNMCTIKVKIKRKIKFRRIL